MAKNRMIKPPGVEPLAERFKKVLMEHGLVDEPELDALVADLVAAAAVHVPPAQRKQRPPISVGRITPGGSA